MTRAEFDRIRRIVLAAEDGLDAVLKLEREFGTRQSSPKGEPMETEALLDAIAEVRERLEDVRRAQNASSDEANPDHLTGCAAALDALEGHASDIVP